MNLNFFRKHSAFRKCLSRKHFFIWKHCHSLLHGSMGLRRMEQFKLRHGRNKKSINVSIKKRKEKGSCSIASFDTSSSPFVFSVKTRKHCLTDSWNRTDALFHDYYQRKSTKERREKDSLPLSLSLSRFP